MKKFSGVMILAIVCGSCVKQPRLPLDSKYGVTSLLNDSLWYGVAKANRIYEQGTDPASVREFNVQLITDLPFPDNGSAGRSPFVSGCLDPECVPTQRLHFYNIPLKKGKHKLSTIDKKRKGDLERTQFWYLMNGGGMLKRYTYEGRKPDWVRISSINKKTGIIEGSFNFQLDEDLTVYNRLKNSIPPVATFDHGLFRVKLVDVKVKPEKK